MLILTVNILAANLHDRGAKIDPVEVLYPYPTVMGKSVRTPMMIGKAVRITPKEVEKALGEDLSADEVRDLLRGYGYEVQGRGRVVVATPPSYRDDILHLADVIEDVAISRGYDQFAPEMPSDFTVGSLSRAERISDRFRELMVGFGFQEVISNILMSREEVLERMRLAQRLVEVDNPVSQTYAVLRNAVLPCLLRVEASSSKAFYPHRMFEVGEVAQYDQGAVEGSRTLLRMGALIAHSEASFSEMHSFLEMLFYYLGRDYELQPADHPSYIPGRAGKILAGGHEIGMIGEIHPGVLENWGVEMPCSGLEIGLDFMLTE